VIKVAIVTPVHNRKNLTLLCLRSLHAADHSGLAIHIIVVDNGSTDGTSEAIHQQFPAVEIVAGDANFWYTAGTNRGIQAALLRKPDYILAINDDQVFHAQALQRLVLCAQQNRKAVIGALLLDWDHPENVMATGGRWDTWYGGWRHPRTLTVKNAPRDRWEVELIVGNCVLYPVEAIAQVGLMNEKAIPMYGDAEYTPRMRRAGWTLMIEPRSYVWCQPNTVSPSLRRLPIRKALSALIFDQMNSNNLIVGSRVYWLEAPSHIMGLVAYFIRIVRLALHRFGLGGSWPAWPDNEYFVKNRSNSLVDEDYTQALATLASLMDMTPNAPVESQQPDILQQLRDDDDVLQQNMPQKCLETKQQGP
jgi:GT2 family glycosyltransferase